jgi:hypothetical protein
LHSPSRTHAFIPPCNIGSFCEQAFRLSAKPVRHAEKALRMRAAGSAEGGDFVAAAAEIFFGRLVVPGGRMSAK